VSEEVRAAAAEAAWQADDFFEEVLDDGVVVYGAAEAAVAADLAPPIAPAALAAAVEAARQHRGPRRAGVSVWIWFADNFYAHRTQWIPLYFHTRVFTGTIRSTQRSEAQNASVKRVLNKASTLTDVRAVLVARSLRPLLCAARAHARHGARRGRQVVRETLRMEYNKNADAWLRLLNQNGQASTRGGVYSLVQELREHLLPNVAAICARSFCHAMLRYNVELVADEGPNGMTYLVHHRARNAAEPHDTVVHVERVAQSKRPDMLPVACSCNKMK
jgi:hypothetical protein